MAAPPFCATSGAQVSLAAGECAVVDPRSTGGSALFPGNPSGAQIEYLLVPQSASGTPNDSQSFRLQGMALALAGVGPERVAQEAPPTELGPAEQFHLFLRRSERARSYPAPAGPAAAPVAEPAPAPQAAATVAPVDSGHVRTFKVCGDLQCSQPLPTVTATALKVGEHIAIYVDNNAPQPGLSQQDLDTLRVIFDTLLYEVDTLAFGLESDVDANGVVLVLMTNRVNQLVADPCPNGFVAGYFFGADIDPFFRTQFNNGEVFYSIVPDPAGTLSCAHTVAQVKRIIPVTFAHEFQHMISYNQHVLVRRRDAEDLWLNEGLSHYAEERVGRSFLPGDNPSFCSFAGGNLYNAGLYFADPGAHFLVDTAGIGGLAERGAYWLFIRYLVDQYAASAAFPDADAFTRTLVQTTLTGVANVKQQTGATFTDVVNRWGLANWVSDLPGFVAPAALQYKSWAFRTDFPRFNQTCSNAIPSSFPLVPGAGDGSAVSLSGTLRAGSGWYHRAQQAAGATGFSLLFTDASGAALRASLVPRLNVIRIQ